MPLIGTNGTVIGTFTGTFTGTPGQSGQYRRDKRDTPYKGVPLSRFVSLSRFHVTGLPGDHK